MLDTLSKKFQTLKKDSEIHTDAFHQWQDTAAHVGEGRQLLEKPDEDVKQSLEALQGYLEEEYGILEQQRQYLEQQRTELSHAVRQEVRKLTASMEALSKAADNEQYGSKAALAKEICRKRLKEYSELLETIEENRRKEAQGWSNIRDNSTREARMFAVMQVKCREIANLMQISPAVRRAIRTYTSDDYKQMNPPLREGRKLSELPPEIYEDICQLHGFLSSCKTEVPLTVYRGIGGDSTMVRTPGGFAGLDQFSDEQLVGKLLADRAFVSTSMDEKASFYEPVKLVLTLPPGCRGAYVAELSSVGDHEDEFLMDMGQVFKVTKVEQRDGVRYIYANCIPINY